jgi:lipoprotein-anchoring transpeptidase ErfK/SrfK
VNGLFGERTWHAVVAFQGWEGLPRDGVVGARTWVELGRARVPLPWGGLARGVEIDRSRQVLLLVDHGRTVRAIHVSTGAFGRTPGGTFAVYRKETLSWSIPFQAWMPYANYFYGGFAVHGYSDVPPYPASHGCVRVPMVEAPVVYAFAGIGTPVWIR